MSCYSHKQIQTFAANAGFPNITVNSKSGNVPLLALMSAISTQESGRCDEPVGTLAKGREISVGIFQINSLVHKNYSVSELKNPTINAKEAYRIYKSQGLNAWGGYSDNKYKKYLNDALKAYGNGQVVIDTNANGDLVIDTNKGNNFSLSTLSKDEKIVLGITGALILYFLL